MRTVQPAPGLVNAIVYNLFIKRASPEKKEPIEIEHIISEDTELGFANGLRAISTPGHTAGHLVFLWPQQGGVLFVGDAATRFLGLGYPPIFEDMAEGRRSLQKMAALGFEVACFSHGKAMVGGAAGVFRKKWG